MNIRFLLCLMGLLANTCYATGISIFNGSNTWFLLDGEKKGVALNLEALYIDTKARFRNARASSSIQGVEFPVSGSSRVDSSNQELIPNLSLRVDFSDKVACFGRIGRPFFAESSPGSSWQGRHIFTASEIDSHGIDASCAYKFNVGRKSRLSFIGGFRFYELQLEALTLTPEALLEPVLGFRAELQQRIAVESTDNFDTGWRLGLAYEIPEYKMGINLVYNSAINTHLSGASTIFLPGNNIVDPTTLSLDIPQSVELQLRSGLPLWGGSVAGLNIRWEEWSEWSSLVTELEGAGTVIRQLNWRDSLSAALNLGTSINDKWALGAEMGWVSSFSLDAGDQWYIGAGGHYTVRPSMEIGLGLGLVHFREARNAVTSVSAPLSEDRLVFDAESVSFLTSQFSVNFKF